MSNMKREHALMKEFIRWMFFQSEGWCDGVKGSLCDFLGGNDEEIWKEAEERGLVNFQSGKKFTVPCGENCLCEEDTDFPIQDYYQLADWLKK